MSSKETSEQRQKFNYGSRNDETHHHDFLFMTFSCLENFALEENFCSDVLFRFVRKGELGHKLPFCEISKLTRERRNAGKIKQ